MEDAYVTGALTRVEVLGAQHIQGCSKCFGEVRAMLDEVDELKARLADQSTVPAASEMAAFERAVRAAIEADASGTRVASSNRPLRGVSSSASHECSDGLIEIPVLLEKK